MSHRLVGTAFVMFAAVAFSFKAILVKLAYRHGVDPLTLLALRMAFSAPFFVAIAYGWSRDGALRRLSVPDWARIAALGLLGYYLASYFDFLGLQYISAALERLVLFLYPTFVVILSALLFGRRITRRDVLALSLSYVGIAMVVAVDLSAGHRNVALGVFWVLLSALCYAIYLVGNGRMVSTVNSVVFACVASVFSCVGVLVHFLLVGEVSQLFDQPWPVYAYSGVMAVVSTVLPVIVMSEGIRRVGSSQASMLGTVGPVATIIFGATLLSEPVTAIQLGGAALVLGGVLFITVAKPQTKTASG